MRLVVADTGPLNYLVLIGAIDLLPKLFETVLVPQAVCDELRHPVAPALVRIWAEHPPRGSTCGRPQLRPMTIRHGRRSTPASARRWRLRVRSAPILC